jgi:hypothetical protein
LDDPETDLIAPSIKHRAKWAGIVGAVGLVTVGSYLAISKPEFGIGFSEPRGGGPPTVRRLSKAQYTNIISDVFGEDVKVVGSFEPDLRDGLLAVASSSETFSSSGAERYYAIARSVATQAVDEKYRHRIAQCEPRNPNGADSACAAEFLGRAGRLLLRRPMKKGELDSAVQLAETNSTSQHDFKAGLSVALASILIKPDFLFVVERADPQTIESGVAKLDGFSLASRISLFLWNSSPDYDLLRAAESGELSTRSGLNKQVQRMLASPRLERGVRAFFYDFLGFDNFDQLLKDSSTYPAYRDVVRSEAQEQTLRTIVQLLLKERGDYRDLFTTRKTFVSRALGPLYRIPVPASTGWTPYEFPPESGQAGILSQVSFTSLHAHPGRGSPTLRGKAIREVFLCQIVPAPPANVNFDLIQDTKNPNMRTARDRLVAHATDPSCSGCHKVMDPMGLTLENFDGAGQHRATENDAMINVNTQVDGTEVDGTVGLGQHLHDNPTVASCLVDKMTRFALGRNIDPREKAWKDYLTKSFAADRYRLPALMQQIAVSKAFRNVEFQVAGPHTETASGASGADAKVAALSP